MQKKYEKQKNLNNSKRKHDVPKYDSGIDSQNALVGHLRPTNYAVLM